MKDQLKEAALDLFINNGYEGTSISQIVKKVEIRKSSFYAHFESKSALFLDLYKDAVLKESERIKHIQEKIEHKDPIDQLLEIYKNLTDPNQGGKELHFFHRMMFYPPLELKEEMLVLFSSVENHSTELIRNQIEKVIEDKQKAEDLLAVFYALIDGLSIQFHLYDEQEHKKRIESAWKMFRENLI